MRSALSQEHEIPFAINGRFLSQPITGVQRYAREVVAALDNLLSAAGRRSLMMTPERCGNVPLMRSVTVRSVGPASGHVWEQVVLPLRWTGKLLNLCNTAPLMRANQIVCIHDANVFRMPESYGVGFRTLYRTLQPLLARRSARITTVSHDAANQLAEHLPLKAAAVTVLPNGHEHALRWNSKAATVFNERPQDREFILLLGSLARHKNIGLILELAGAFDGLGLDLLVAGAEASVFATQRKVNASNIRWLGHVSDDDLALLFSKALCLTFPSLTEGFGLPIVEAMALGCPVISSDRASMMEVCGDAAMLASPENPAAWVAHVAALKTSDRLREDLRDRGRRQARRFSWTATARGYLDILEGKS